MTSKEKEPTGALAAKIAEERMEERAKESSQEDEQILKAVLNELKGLGYTETSAFYLRDVCEMLAYAIKSERNKAENDRRTAGQCLRFKYGRCSSKGCKNIACPSNEKEKD